MFDLIAVKVYVSIVDDDDNQIDFDTKKIKVTVTTSFPKINKYSPVVKLKRLTEQEISEYTKIRTDRKSSYNQNVPVTLNMPGGILTRSKKQKFIESGGIIPVYESTLKRKSDFEKTLIPHPKKQKLSNDKGLPKSEIIPIASNEQSKFEASKRMETQQIPNTTVAVMPFKINEIVWGKIRGWPHWPARITVLEGRRYEVIWFNDYRKSKLFPSQVFKFTENFEKFAVKFPNSVGLQTAAKEALIFMAHLSKK